MRGGVRFLHGQAVEGTEAPGEVARVQCDNLASAEQGLEDFACNGVGWITKGGHQYDVVGDVKVGVAGGQTFAFMKYGARQWQLDNTERGIVGV